MLRKNTSAWICTWLTIFAVVWSALMPGFAQANRSADSFLGSICTSAGLKWVDTYNNSADNKAGQAAQDSHAERCVWCSAQPPSLNPSATIAPVLALSFITIQTPTIAQPKVRLIPWAIAPSRAPPLVA